MTPIRSFRAPLCAAVLALAAGAAYAASGLASVEESEPAGLGCGGSAILSIDSLRGGELEWTMGTNVHDSVQVASPWLEGMASCGGGQMLVSLVETAATGAADGARGSGHSVRVEVALSLAGAGEVVSKEIGGRTYTIRAARAG